MVMFAMSLARQLSFSIPRSSMSREREGRASPGLSGRGSSSRCRKRSRTRTTIARFCSDQPACTSSRGTGPRRVATTSSISVITVERSGFFMSFAPPPLCARVSHRLIASSGAEVERAAPAGGCVGRGVHKLSRVPNPLDLQGRSNKCTPQGDRVAVLTVWGADAERVCVPERYAVEVPEDLDPSEVVSLVLPYVTAYQLLHRLARVKSGETVLVHGAAGRVGSAVLELGALAGLRLYGTASAHDRAAVERLGAVAIDYRNEDFVARVRSLPGRGMDVVLDGLGGAV